jgi:hypothetical protein
MGPLRRHTAVEQRLIGRGDIFDCGGKRRFGGKTVIGQYRRSPQTLRQGPQHRAVGIGAAKHETAPMNIKDHQIRACLRRAHPQNIARANQAAAGDLGAARCAKQQPRGFREITTYLVHITRARQLALLYQT